jgi:hypothetical protein
MSPSIWLQGFAALLVLFPAATLVFLVAKDAWQITALRRRVRRKHQQLLNRFKGSPSLPPSSNSLLALYDWLPTLVGTAVKGKLTRLALLSLVDNLLDELLGRIGDSQS